mgnify:CR=1 FL=1
MPDTLTNVRRRVRLLTDDLDPNAPAIDSERLNTLIENRMHLTAAEVGLGPSWITAAVTVAADDYDYTLPTSIQYQRVIALQLNSLEWLMERVTHLELQAMRDGPGPVTGAPPHNALFEDTSQQVNLWLYPTPRVADTINVLRAQVPAALSTDATNIPFSDPLLRAMEKSCALEAILLMDPEERSKRKATLDTAGRWEREISRATHLERVRIGNLRRSDKVPQRMV